MIRPSQKSLVVIVSACSLLFGWVMPARPQESRETLAFVNVAVVPMDSAHVEMAQTVIVRDGRIADVGAVAQIDVPESAFVIDGRGRYLMPGLADMHVHLDSEDPGMLSVFLANGVTTVRNMSGNAKLLELREKIDNGDLPGPTIYTTGPILDGNPPAFPGSVVVTTPAQAAKEVEAEKEAGFDAIKVLDNLSPEVYGAILNAAQEHGLPVYGHVPWRVGIEPALGGGQTSFEHMTDWMHALLPKDSPARHSLLGILAGEQPMTFQGYMVQPFRNADKARIPDLVARSAAAGVWFCPTLVVSRRLTSTADELHALRSLSAIKFAPPSQWAYWDAMQAAVKSQKPDPLAMKAGFNTMLESVGALHKAGVGLLVGTDTPNPFVVPGFSVHEELQNFVAAGLKPYEAIRAATLDAAEFLGASGEFGIVAVGRRADLILADANPLEDVGNVAHRVGVSVRGRWFSEEDLRVLLNELAEEYARTKRESEPAESE